MSDHVLYIQWGNAVVGREAKSVEMYMHAMEFFHGLKNQGAIEDCDFVSFETGNTTHSLGCLMVKGSKSQLMTVWEMDKFREISTKAREVAQDFCVNWGLTGDLLKTRIEELSKWRKELGL